MKTYLECIQQAALDMKATNHYNSYYAIINYIAPILNRAADMYAEQSKSHIPVVVRGAVTSHCISNDIHNCPFTQTCPECTKPATEPLPAEGSAKSVSVDECDHNIIESPHGYYCSKCNRLV